MARTIAKDHDAKREDILKTAAAVFAKDGVDRSSMNQIAAACGISKANIYHYYKGKDALLFDIIESYLRALRDRVLAAEVPGAPPEERLRAAVHEVLRAYQGADDHHRIQVSGLSALPRDRQEALRDYQRQLVAHVSAILAELAPDRLSDRKALRDATMSVFGMLNWYFMWSPGAGPEARGAYADFVTDLTLNGIRDCAAA